MNFQKEAKALGLTTTHSVADTTSWKYAVCVGRHEYLFEAKQYPGVWITTRGFDFNRNTNPSLNGAIGPFDSVAAALATYRLTQPVTE